MEEDERLCKKIRQAEALRGVPPEATLRMGFSLCRFGQGLQEVGDQVLKDDGDVTVPEDRSHSPVDASEDDVPRDCSS